LTLREKADRRSTAVRLTTGQSRKAASDPLASSGTQPESRPDVSTRRGIRLSKSAQPTARLNSVESPVRAKLGFLFGRAYNAI